MRIAVVGPIPPPMGGMALQTAALAELLGKDGHCAQLISCNPTLFLSWLERVPVLRAVVRLAQYVRCLRKHLNNIDVMHVMANSGWSWYLFAVPAIVIAHARRIPVVMNYRGGLAEAFFKASYKRIAPTLAKVDTIIVPTSFLQHVFEQYGHHADIVPNIVDTSLFVPTDNHGRRLVIVVTRNLEKIYGIDTALNVLARVLTVVPDAALVICGEGPERASLNRLANTLGISGHVQFVGRLNRTQLVQQLHEARLLLNTSRVDNSPNSLIEAMSMGLPIVSTNAGGISHLCTHEKEALLANVDDVAALATAVIRVHQEDTLRALLIAHGFETAKQFSWPNVSQKLFHAYSQAMIFRRSRYA